MDTSPDIDLAVAANARRSVLLIACFPLVLPIVLFALTFGVSTIAGSPHALRWAIQGAAIALVVMLGVTLVWLPLGYLMYQWIIDRSTDASLLERNELPRLWRIFEGLCETAGIAHLPALRIIDADELNAYATGLGEGSYSVTVTRGLVEALDDDELRAVLAHELAHIKHQDVRLLVVATVLVGAVPMLHDFVMKAFWGLVMFILTTYRTIFTLLPVPGVRLLVDASYTVAYWAGRLAAYVVGLLSMVVSLAIHFALSRRREFMADAAAAAMTGEPYALISALRKISGLSSIDVRIDNVRAMLFHNAILPWGGLFATHPPVEARIAALQTFMSTHGYAEALSPAASSELPVAHPRVTAQSYPSSWNYGPGRGRAERREPTFDAPAHAQIDPPSLARYLTILRGATPQSLSHEERQHLFDRARRAVDRAYENAPSTPGAQIAVARASLEEAIRQIEEEISAKR